MVDDERPFLKSPAEKLWIVASRASYCIGKIGEQIPVRPAGSKLYVLTGA
jgi:hypothetical protein